MADTPRSDPILRVAGLTRYFDVSPPLLNRLLERTGRRIVKAVDGVSWHIDRGETIALVGESGSGKSVSAMALLRLTDTTGGRIESGQILLRRRNGECLDVTQQSPNVMRAIRGNDVSMIFQEPMTSLNPVFTIGDQISEAIMLHQRKSRQEALAIACSTSSPW